MIRPLRHISFDLDGTLVHTAPAYRHMIVPSVIAHLGGKRPAAHAVDRFWFEPNRDQIIREEFGLDPAVFWNYYRSFEVPQQRRAYTHAYEDAEPLLRALKAQGKLVSIITGAPHWIAQMEIGLLNGADYGYYHSITDGPFREKPDPASFHFVLQKLRVRPEETVYIGNGNEDAAFARNAGTAFIYIERHEHDFFSDDNALMTVHSLADLLIPRARG